MCNRIKYTDEMKCIDHIIRNRQMNYTCDVERIGTNQFSGISSHHSLG
jgi:hypothetical protein